MYSAILLFVCLTIGETVAAGFPRQTLRYAVNHARQKAGELEISFSRSERLLMVAAVTHLGFLAQMFLAEQRSEVFQLRKWRISIV